MKVSIKDPQMLRAIRPLELAAHLRSTGWREERRIGDKASVWLLDHDSGDTLEIILPLDPHLRDFGTRMAESLETLAAAEERSSLEILNDLATASADIIRVRSTSPDDEDGSIALEDGIAVIQHAKDVMVSAACAAIDARPYYHTRKPEQAMEYLRRVRLGQTERGSYVVTLISPVPPSLSAPEHAEPSLFPDLVPDPFERQVTRTLSTALLSTKHAALQAMGSGSFDPFLSSVPKGVNANLCDALAKMARGTEIEISLSWARTRAEPKGTPSRILIPRDAMPVIEEAGRMFREANPEPYEVHGYVVKLQRVPDADQGEATILDDTGERPRRVTVTLSDLDYRRATEAHRDGIPVTCCGDLAKEGGAFRLRNAHRFSLQPETQ